jgi:hypothetical protein
MYQPAASAAPLITTSRLALANKEEKMSIDLEAAVAVLDCPEEDDLVHRWRREQLEALGVPEALAVAFAGRVDWHAVAALVGRGCPPDLALEIAS